MLMIDDCKDFLDGLGIRLSAENWSRVALELMRVRNVVNQKVRGFSAPSRSQHDFLTRSFGIHVKNQRLESN